MKTMLTLGLLLLPTAAFAEDLAPIRKQVEEQVAKLPVTAQFDISYAGNANPKQMLDLYLPKTKASDKPLPVVVFIHGGAWKNGDRIRSAGTVLPYVTSGKYAGISVSYRLSDEAKWPAQIHDCKAVIRWIRANAAKYGLDADHIGVMGSSAGGHLVSLLGTTGDVSELEGDVGPYKTQNSRVTCVVNICGPQDFQMPLMMRDGKPVTEDPAVAGLLGGALAEKKDAVIASSPITYVTKDDAPFLTLHGTKDERVDFKHALRIDEALTKVGVSSLLVPITGQGHGLSHPQMHARIGQFFDRHLRGGKVEIPAGALEPVAKK